MKPLLALSILGLIFITVLYFDHDPVNPMGRRSIFPMLSLIIVIIAMPIMSWFTTKKIEESMGEKIQAFTELAGAKNEPKKAALKLLSPTEKKVVEFLLATDYVALQSDISREMDKLRTHRAVKSLQAKGVIEVHPKGRTKFLKLKKEFRELLS